MGGNCGSAQPEADNRPLAVRYADAGLMQPFSMDYKNNFEKEIYYAINMLRTNPQSFVRQAQATVYRGLVKKSRAVELAAECLQSMAPTQVLKFDDSCNAAVRANNEAICQAEQQEPVEGGNLAKFKEQAGDGREPLGVEYSFYGY
mmetsp:Transcript_24386/g.30285  ORF Transcript_24386/g.30285 Transcript_24386/m.30285 type:complete len:146 (-) Transcript_24386:265-702(-)